MRAKPYVGITGFKTVSEVKAVNAIFNKSDFNNNKFSHWPMFGFIVTDKRLADFTKGGTQSPPAKELPWLLRRVPPHYLPMIHYYTENVGNLAAEIEQVFSISSMYEYGDCSAVQLNNVDWPPITEIKKIKQRFSSMDIVLQLPKQVMEGKSISEIVNRARDYDGLVRYALIDPSGGLGIDFDVEKSLELMTSLYQAMPNTQIGIAGGFSGENVEERIQVIQDYYIEPFCIDAQGKLRSDADKGRLDLEKVQRYITGAARVLREYEIR
ncbi:MAG: hypothetical protein Q8R37_03055 [Nanoarchaeota archaeon]|nr:hypothetical protein [Nanoarchaeota archaeon]